MQEKLRIGITTYIHLLVDFVCAYWMFHMLRRQDDGFVPCGWKPFIDKSDFLILFYNFCAFALQLPIGWLVDRFWKKKPWWISSIGCMILAVTGGMIFWEYIQRRMDPMYYTTKQGICFSIALGIGNALFHVGAGVEVLHLASKGARKRHRCRWGTIASIDHSDYRMTPVGIFVSSGVLGLCLGNTLAEHIKIMEEVVDYERVITCFSLITIGLMLGAAGLNLLLTRYSHIDTDSGHTDTLLPDSSHTASGEDLTDQADRTVVSHRPWNQWIILLLFLVVVLRSLQRGNPLYRYGLMEIVMVSALCITLGKALGGILADRIGVLWAAILPLLCSACLLLVASDWIVPNLIAVLLFQTTMPITLSLMHRQMPRCPGMAFGLLSFGLFLGRFPDMLSKIEMACRMKWSFFSSSFWWNLLNYEHLRLVIAVISLVLLLLMLCLWKRSERNA